MARPEVPDTTVLIPLLRDPRRLPTFQRAFATGRIWLSSVVMGELYAGTRSPDDALYVDRLMAAIDRRQRLLVPTVRE